MRSLIVVGRRFRQAALLAALIGSAIGADYIARAVKMLILLSSVVGNHNVVEDFVINARGDKVEASTEASENANDPMRSVVRLKRAHGWFLTTLLKTESYGFRWDPKWLDDDILDLNIGFGCVERVSRPVTTVGRIRISYHFEYNDRDLDLDLARSGHSGPAGCRAVHHSHR
jgi:hypothetical protein